MTRRPDVAIAIIAHDHREGIGEHELLRAVHVHLDPGVRDRATTLITPRLRAREVKRLVADVDLVCTGRLHLAVASLGAGTPVVSIAYQDKFAGLYQHFGLEPLLLTHEASIEPGGLEALVEAALVHLGDLRSRVTCDHG